MQTCWRFPWKQKCLENRRYSGKKYCVDISCEHDPMNRFVGCHKDVPWHKPTCNECAKLFPKACGAELTNYAVETRPTGAYKALVRMSTDELQEYTERMYDLRKASNPTDSDASSDAEVSGSSKADR